MVKRAIALDGTCTGEHGVGIGKKAYLYDELGEGTVELMKTVKRALDPHNLFNPGKVSSTAVDGCVWRHADKWLCTISCIRTSRSQRRITEYCSGVRIGGGRAYDL